MMAGEEDEDEDEDEEEETQPYRVSFVSKLCLFHTDIKDQYLPGDVQS